MPCTVEHEMSSVGNWMIMVMRTRRFLQKMMIFTGGHFALHNVQNCPKKVFFLCTFFVLLGVVVQFHSELLVHLELVNIVLLILSTLYPGTL